MVGDQVARSEPVRYLSNRVLGFIDLHGFPHEAGSLAPGAGSSTWERQWVVWANPLGRSRSSPSLRRRPPRSTYATAPRRRPPAPRRLPRGARARHGTRRALLAAAAVA